MFSFALFLKRSRCNIHMKNGKVYMKHNSLGDDVPIVVILRAMGATSDQEIVQLVSDRAAGPGQKIRSKS